MAAWKRPVEIFVPPREKETRAGDRDKGERGERERGDRERGDRERGDRERGDRERGDREKGDREKSEKEKEKEHHLPFCVIAPLLPMSPTRSSSPLHTSYSRSNFSNITMSTAGGEASSSDSRPETTATHLRSGEAPPHTKGETTGILLPFLF